MEVFEQIYIEYSPRIYKFLYKLCGNQAEAEELTQETFYRALKGFDKFRGDSSVFTWLAGITKRTYYSYLKVKRRGLDNINLTAVVDSYYLNDDGTADAALKDLITKKARELLHELPDKYRDVAILRIYADMTFAQIGQTMGITENSAKVIYYRAKKMLKEKLE